MSSYTGKVVKHAGMAHEKGRLVIEVDSPAAVQVALGLYRGKRVLVTITEAEDDTDLRGYYFAVVVPAIMKKTGHTKNETHEGLRDRYAGKGSSWTTMDPEQRRDYVEWARAEGLALGADIPPPMPKEERREKEAADESEAPEVEPEDGDAEGCLPPGDKAR